MTVQAGETDALPCAALHRPVTAEGRHLLDVLDRHLPGLGEAAADNDRHAVFPTGSFKDLAADGVMGATVPHDLGGLGVGSVHDVCLAVLRTAEADPSTALCLHMQWSRGLTMTYEARHGTPRHRALAERILRLMGTGGGLIAGALRDAGVTTEIVPAVDGGWTLTGRKIMVSMAPHVTHFVVAARTRPESGPPRQASILVPADAEGLSVPGEWDGLGMRASASTAVAFDGCPIPPYDVFERGPVDERDDAALAGQAVSSIGLLGVYAGIAQAARDITVGELRRRAARGADVQGATRTLVAEMDVKLYTLRTALAAALTNTDHYAYRFLDDPDDRGRLMMRPFQYAKLAVNRSASAIVEDCMTLLGGVSFTAGHPLSRLYRDVRAGWFMQPYTYADAVDRLSAWTLGLD